MDNQIDFTVMGFDSLTSAYLNKCMKHRNNLEYEIDSGVQDLKSASATLYFDHFGEVGRIDRQLVDRRAVLHAVEIFKTIDTKFGK